jgi:hypothetical protein
MPDEVMPDQAKPDDATSNGAKIASATSTLAPAAAHLLAEAIAHISTDADCLWVSDAAVLPPNTAQWTTRTASALLSEPWQKRYALAIAHLPDTLTASQALHLLSSLRDLHARQVLAFIPVDAFRWQAADLLALGMQRHARFEQEQQLIEAWSFDIKTYKPVPDWLNPRFWANPENWNRFRW